jgi:hypothetical protein
VHHKVLWGNCADELLTDRGDKMKRSVVLVMLVVAALFILWAKCLDGGLGFAVNGDKLTVRVANPPLLNSSEYPIDIKNIYLIGFVVLLVFWRGILLRLTWR